MPELPEVETTKTSLAPLLGQKVTNVQVFQPKLRWSIPDNLADLVDYTLDSVERRAKYLILNFIPLADDGISSTVQPRNLQPRQLLVHLGMSGSLQQHNHASDKRKHDHLIMSFIGADSTQTQLHYYDPRRFGSILWLEEYGDKLLNHLGPEPLSDAFTADYLYHLIQRSRQSIQTQNSKSIKKQPIKRAIKSVIMEQQAVVGVGNIYATESLYLSGIHPATPANEVSYAQIVILVAHIKTILQKAIKLGGSTLRDFTVADGQTGYFQQTLNVYGRQGNACPHCESTLENIKLNGRASVYCPLCQPIISM
ncbi:DNA-(apurinic or apyrimidinic site) lyase / Formamidopyrimidine-DNA glycosylase [Psychrobacter arcticus 273-4]|uniref:Formamidopyrimidine-DNA glycosylase n=1 Tax=Psychrobacter arcticus (strain DSM 17307 / VKM B-2377 / 273-4) TaxID=259536 RepID=FPG_PSYA2|nr:bifunctional DNA-formamidopyrimidine glycosylase/DNA-(apurinic or apyrimidinic site) lyase [Psychrobacter arcticus]Q4FUU7.3 RecName: Full=Formamidopyrimidine-DNA glycosylase; Short=Fapy-DNA glycosylase; AltName: Full=DNA-(apurinic or apyrimidinic site) lyase MutM; Short=AP lyase MutM [Psychrobacter arcticus 273-4]AAZ18211.1 DNA-(apurinic or apyrimidinic site) lyase / Formamidopyrimidine-DNA glycosylase [Psychrobacter arcticus 273-4]